LRSRLRNFVAGRRRLMEAGVEHDVSPMRKQEFGAAADGIILQKTQKFNEKLDNIGIKIYKFFDFGLNIEIFFTFGRFDVPRIAPHQRRAQQAYLRSHIAVV
jgi:hypothetical protein